MQWMSWTAPLLGWKTGGWYRNWEWRNLEVLHFCGESQIAWSLPVLFIILKEHHVVSLNCVVLFFCSLVLFFWYFHFFSHSFLLLSLVLFLVWFGDVFGGNCCALPSVVSCVVLFPRLSLFLKCFSLCCGDDASFLCFAPCQVFPGVLLYFCWHFLCFFVVFFLLFVLWRWGQCFF